MDTTMNAEPKATLKLLPILLVLAVAASTPVLAADDTAGDTSGNAADIIAKTGAFYAANPALAADVVVNLELPPQMAKMGDIPPMPFRYLFRSPNSIALIPSAGGMAPPTVQDGQQYYTEMPMMGVAVVRPAMPLAYFFSEEGGRYLQHPGAKIILGLGLDGETPGSLRSMSGAELAGAEMIDGTDCWRLEIDGPEFKGEIWVAKGDEPWVIRIHKPAPEPESSNDKGMRFSPGLDIRISDWDADPEFGDAFTIKPNEDLEIRDTLPTTEEMMAKMGQRNSPGEDHPSLDKPAPDVTLHLMEGGDRVLADLKGQVVVLDFWATWCKPCIMALPLVAQATGELEDKGVVFFAVNQLESASQVATFLKKMDLDIPVALDKSGTTSRAFGVSSIPHSVIIDKKGVVRKVHVGFGPGMDKMLKKEIEELLAE